MSHKFDLFSSRRFDVVLTWNCHHSSLTRFSMFNISASFPVLKTVLNS